MNLALELTDVSPVTILPMEVKRLREPSVRPGARSCNPLGLVRPYCDGVSLLSGKGIPTLRSVSLLLTMELAIGRLITSRLRLRRFARKVGK
jgi:hypothetical protein